MNTNQNPKAKRVSPFVFPFVFISLFLILTSCSNSVTLDLTNNKPENMGNTMGNLLNAGLVTNDGDSIYYITSEGTKVFLNKMGMNGEHQVLIDKMYYFVNVEGDFIYYIDPADEAIYRMGTDFVQSEKLYDVKARFLLVADDTIYALGGDSDKYAGDLYSMDINGSGFNILSDDKIWQVYFYNNEIYYTTQSNGQTSLYKIDIYGGNKEQIARDIELGDWFHIYDGKVFYVSQSLGLGVAAIRGFDVKSKEDSLVYELEPDSFILINGCINAVDNMMFFLATGAPRTYTYLNLDTGEVKSSKIRGDSVIGFYTIGNKIIYYVDDQPYIMNFDGTDKKRFNRF